MTRKQEYFDFFYVDPLVIKKLNIYIIIFANYFIQYYSVMVIIFGSVRFLSKKITKPIFFKKKPNPNQNRVKPIGFGSVRFLEQKHVQTSLSWFFRFSSVLAWFFPVLARFFNLARFFWFGSVFFPFFRFRFGSVFCL